MPGCRTKRRVNENNDSPLIVLARGLKCPARCTGSIENTSVDLQGDQAPDTVHAHPPSIDTRKYPAKYFPILLFKRFCIKKKKKGCIHSSHHHTLQNKNLDTRETSIFFDRENKYFPRFRFCKTDFRAHSEIEIINWIIFILHQFQDVRVPLNILLE